MTPSRAVNPERENGRWLPVAAMGKAMVLTSAPVSICRRSTNAAVEVVESA
jgi:hypothetical protein